MKKLSIEQKAKAYDEALERAKVYHKQLLDEDNPEWASEIEKIFPELKESEDEKIRKALIRFHKSTIDVDGIKGEDILAWLEKQGEQKPVDKVEPKFHKGEWIVWKNKCYKVNYNGCGYELIDQNGLSTSLEYGTVDENAHLWDITKDAKDGDVLYSLDSCQPFIYKERKPFEQTTAYCGLNIYGKFFVWGTKDCIITLSNYVPSTKEQRDTLMKAMTDAGYMFDFEKKELKKIKQKPAWSVEDERLIEEAAECLRKYASKVQGGNSKVYVLSLADRIESLRPQNTWKPSDEQIKALHDLNLTGNISYAGQGQVLIELYNDLKKLKG